MTLYALFDILQPLISIARNRFIKNIIVEDVWKPAISSSCITPFEIVTRIYDILYTPIVSCRHVLSIER